MRKYDALSGHLRRQTADELEMTFTEIERVIGAMLPKSASRPQWWANEEAADSRHVQVRAWRNAGYDAFLVRDAERVRFTRRVA